MSGPLPYAVLDVDGVLADVRHRLHHLAGPAKDWSGFFAAAPEDPPLPEGLRRARELARDHQIVYLTGRPERCRVDTLAWFARHGLPEGQLLMRADRDRRPAHVTKVEALHRLGRDREVAVVVDDDLRVVSSVEAAGFSVELATWMHETPEQQRTLFDAQERQGLT